MKWLDNLLASKQITDRKENTDRINDIPLVELERLFKITAISILEKGKVQIKISKYNRDLDTNYIFKRGAFSILPTYGAGSTTYICNNVRDLLNDEKNLIRNRNEPEEYHSVWHSRRQPWPRVCWSQSRSKPDIRSQPGFDPEYGGLYLGQDRKDVQNRSCRDTLRQWKPSPLLV